MALRNLKPTTQKLLETARIQRRRDNKTFGARTKTARSATAHKLKGFPKSARRSLYLGY